MSDWITVDLSEAVFGYYTDYNGGAPFGHLNEAGHIVTNGGWPDFWFMDFPTVTPTRSIEIEVTYATTAATGTGAYSIAADYTVESYQTGWFFEWAQSAGDANVVQTLLCTATDDQGPDALLTPEPGVVIESHRDGEVIAIRYRTIGDDPGPPPEPPPVTIVDYPCIHVAAAGPEGIAPMDWMSSYAPSPPYPDGSYSIERGAGYVLGADALLEPYLGPMQVAGEPMAFQHVMLDAAFDPTSSMPVDATWWDEQYYDFDIGAYVPYRGGVDMQFLPAEVKDGDEVTLVVQSSISGSSSTFWFPYDPGDGYKLLALHTSQQTDDQVAEFTTTLPEDFPLTALANGWSTSMYWTLGGGLFEHPQVSYVALRIASPVVAPEGFRVGWWDGEKIVPVGRFPL